MNVINGELKNVNAADIKLLENEPEKFWEGVTEIGSYAFMNNYYLKSIKIPSQIKSIGLFAFMNCPNLKKVELSEGLESLGTAIFYNCNCIKSIKIPKSVKNMDFKVFDGCDNLVKIKLKSKKNLEDDLKVILEGFRFDDIIQNGDEITFIRDINKEEERDI